MTPAPWIEDARRMLAEGHSVRAISRALGVSRTSLRYRLNINGARDQDRYARSRAIRPEPVAAPVAPEPAKISLQFVSILAGHVSPAYRMVRL